MPEKRGETADLTARIHALIVRILRLPAERVVPGASLLGDLECDSMSIMDLLEALESEFELEIPTSAAEQIDTVGDIESYLRRRGIGA